MPVSASKAARQAARAAKAGDKKTAASKLSSKNVSANGSKASSVNGDESPMLSEDEIDIPATGKDKQDQVQRLADQMDKHGLSDRVTTGVLASLEASRDVKVTSASLVFHGKVLIQDSTIEVNFGRRYGLLGENGCGKSTLLKAIDKREFPFPDHIDIYLLNEGAPPSDFGALEWVVKEAQKEVERLDNLAEEILEKEGPESPTLLDLYERSEAMDPSTFETRASLILTGLGFNKKTIHKKTKDMSGGWRMRVALARALFVKPSLLLLDDPTAHLDLEACVWLEEYMKKWDKTLILVSHSQDFLNGVCTNMIDMRQKQLIYYGGNYDSYVKTRAELETNQQKAYVKQQDEITHIKKFIASAGTYANLVRQAKSRQKILDKMEADGFIQPVVADRIFTFRFADVEKLPPPVLSFDDVTFSYSAFFLERKSCGERERTGMGQIVKRKKKGRPSKADLARRPISPAPETESEVRRSLRRRNVRYDIDYYEDYFDDEDDDDHLSAAAASNNNVDDDEEQERRREKKLKLVLKLNNSHDSTEPPCSRSSARAYHASSDDNNHHHQSSDDEEDEDEDKPLKKRRISGADASESEEEDNYDDEGRKMEGKVQDSGTPTRVVDRHNPTAVALPEKKSLELILDKLQKKDTYGVYAEPVDPEELPDYHDVIEHPMDFATVRKKLGNGSYATLDQFESDVFLICSNAMQYNAPDTVYHKQARAIQELATKKFHRLRVGIERAEKEAKAEKELKLEKEHKLEKDLKLEQKVKSNFLAKKQTKKPFSRTIQEPVGSDFSSGATLATAGDMQNGSVATHVGGCERPSSTDGLVEGNTSMVDNQEKVEDLSSGKGLLSKLGRKPVVMDENRRATYNISNQPVARSESIFTTFEGEIKQLVAVGLHAEYSYARSLARFAASLGPVAWKVASQRIEQALPPGYKFGRGWVGEYEPLPTPVLMLESRAQKESALFSKLQTTADVRKDDIAFKTPAPVKVSAVGRPISEGNASLFCPVNGSTSEGRSPFASSAGPKPFTPVSGVNQQQNPFSRTFAEPENKVSKQVELNLPPSASQNNGDLVAGKQSTNKLELAASRSSEMMSRNRNLLHSLTPKQLTNNGVASGGLPNGKVTSNSGTTGMMSQSSDNVGNPMARAATYFPHVQDQGLTDPVQLMRMLNEKAQKQQNSSNQSLINTPPAKPSAPSVRRDDSTNATQAAARAWMSVGAGGVKQASESSSSPKNQISAESLYNPARELHPQMSRVRGEFPLSVGMQFQPDKNSFQHQAFVPQPVRPVNEAQFLNRPPMVFPHFVATDLSRFQMQLPWRGLSPHTQPRQKQETLPPDLNISFQSPGSPVKQSSNVLVDSQQPDLALQL